MALSEQSKRTKIIIIMLLCLAAALLVSIFCLNDYYYSYSQDMEPIAYERDLYLLFNVQGGIGPDNTTILENDNGWVNTTLTIGNYLGNSSSFKIGWTIGDTNATTQFVGTNVSGLDGSNFGYNISLNDKHSQMLDIKISDIPTYVEKITFSIEQNEKILDTLNCKII